MQVFHVEDNSRVEGRCGKSKQCSPRSDYNWLSAQRERLAILCAEVPEEGASKPRRGSELHRPKLPTWGLKVSSSPAV